LLIIYNFIYLGSKLSRFNDDRNDKSLEMMDINQKSNEKNITKSLKLNNFLMSRTFDYFEEISDLQIAHLQKLFKTFLKATGWIKGKEWQYIIYYSTNCYLHLFIYLSYLLLRSFFICFL